MRIVRFGKCPYCGKEGVVRRSGYDSSGYQRFRCSACGKTFTGRSTTILDEAKLMPWKINELLSLLIDGLTLRQASHASGGSLPTALLWRDKLLAVLKHEKFPVLSGEVWVDETYLRVNSEDMIYSHKRGEGKRGLNKDLLQVCCGIDANKRYFALVGGRGTMSTKDAETYYRGRVAPGSIVHSDEGHYGTVFKDCHHFAVKAGSPESKILNKINNFTDQVQRYFKIHLGTDRRYLSAYLHLICFCSQRGCDGYDEKVDGLIKRVWNSDVVFTRNRNS
jgi:transposase-like protein